jgi:hypothetical protein
MSRHCIEGEFNVHLWPYLDGDSKPGPTARGSRHSDEWLVVAR